MSDAVDAVVVDEDAEMDLDEMLDWLCWAWATDAENFYPPGETAQQCIEALEAEETVTVDAEGRGWERGQHARAFTEVVERYANLESRGFDPRGRAEREIARTRADGMNLPAIDWTWYDEASMLGDDDG